MSNFKCCRCKRTFDEEDAGLKSEYVGDFWGSPIYTNITVCPHCGYDEYEEVEETEDE